MRLVTFETPRGERRLGALLGADRVLDLNRALALELALRDVGAPEAEADSLLPAQALRFLARGDVARRAADEALRFATDALERYDGPDLARAGALWTRREVRLRAPIPRPGKIVGVADDPDATQPALFLKASSAVIGPEDELRLPADGVPVSCEGRLAAVVGRTARDVTPATALAHLAGYTAANDVAAVDWRSAAGDRSLAASRDGFAPLGPVLVTADEIPDPHDLGIVTRVAGETRRAVRTKELRFPLAEVVSFASRWLTLEPGDVVLTGAPAPEDPGDGAPRRLREGDVIEVEIERVGRLRNHVRGCGSGDRSRR